MGSRRRLFLASLAAAAQPAIQPEVFMKSPGKGTAIMGIAYYTKPAGIELVSLEQRWSRSDTIDTVFRRTSKDNGRTWSGPVESKTGEKRPNGSWRKHPRAGLLIARAALERRESRGGHHRSAIIRKRPPMLCTHGLVRAT